MDINLATLTVSQGFRIIGENSGDLSGYSVKGAGDVNNDGYADIIIGGLGASGAAGKSYVIFGRASGFSDINLKTLDMPVGFRIIGEDNGDDSGWSVSSAGDFNGDGFDDVIIGAPQVVKGGTGKSYVIFGKASRFSDINLNILSSSQGFKIIGENYGDECGLSVSSAGDFNGDGFSDVIIGAPAGRGRPGKSYVIFGKANGFSDINLSTLGSTQGFRIIGENTLDASGTSVSGAGDINGDKFADIIISAPYASSEAGKSYVIFGKANGFSDISLSTLIVPIGFRILGEKNPDHSGVSVSGAGDINKDGYADIIVGTATARISYIIFGKITGAFSDISLSALSMPIGFKIIDENPDYWTENSVSGAGDVNGDGFADIIIGGYGALTSTGKSYVVYGKANGFVDINLDTLSSTQGFRITGEKTLDASGGSVSGAGDINKDGYDDIIIGAPGINNTAGKSYVIFGAPINTNTDSNPGLSTGDIFLKIVLPITAVAVISFVVVYLCKINRGVDIGNALIVETYGVAQGTAATIRANIEPPNLPNEINNEYNVLHDNIGISSDPNI